MSHTILYWRAWFTGTTYINENNYFFNESYQRFLCMKAVILQCKNHIKCRIKSRKGTGGLLTSLYILLHKAKKLNHSTMKRTLHITIR